MSRWVAGCLAFALGACLTPGQQRRDSFLRVAREFNDDLRWGRYETAVGNLPPDEAQRFLERVRLVGPDLQLGDQEVTQITFESDDAATVDVRFEWFSRREMVVHNTSLRQRWEHRGGRWLLVEQRRLGGDRFALVPERATAAQ